MDPYAVDAKAVYLVEAMAEWKAGKKDAKEDWKAGCLVEVTERELVGWRAATKASSFQAVGLDLAMAGEWDFPWVALRDDDLVD